MAGKSTENLDLLIFVIITVGMVILALAIICSVFFYQRKLQRRKNELKNIEIAYQKDLVSAAIDGREQEKRRIAFELHDDIGSTLTAVKFGIASASMSDEEKKTLNDNLGVAINKVRQISYEMMPSILEELGIIAGINSLIGNLNSQVKDIEFEIQAVNDPKSENQTPDIELAIYRVIQELMNNIIKYSEASHVSVLFIQDELGLDVTIDDDGKGFDPAVNVDKTLPSLGMRNIAMRLQHIGGTINFTKKERGTKVRVQWKVKA